MFQSGPKRPKMSNWTCLGLFMQKLIFHSKALRPRSPMCFQGIFLNFWLKSSKRIQMDTLWFQMINHLFISCFGPFCSADKRAMFGNFCTPPFPNITSLLYFTILHTQHLANHLHISHPQKFSPPYNSPFFIFPTGGRLVPGSHWALYGTCHSWGSILATYVGLGNQEATRCLFAFLFFMWFIQSILTFHKC